MAARLPAFAAACVAEHQQGGAGAACLSHAASARTLLLTEGWGACQLDRSFRGPAAGRGGGYRTWRMATRLAASCVAHSQLLLPRPRDAAVVDAGPPSPASLPVRPTRWRVAGGHTRRAGHDVVPARHAGGPAQALAPSPARSTAARVTSAPCFCLAARNPHCAPASWFSGGCERGVQHV